MLKIQYTTIIVKKYDIFVAGIKKKGKENEKVHNHVWSYELP